MSELVEGVKVSRLSAKDFRNYSELELELDNGIQLLTGQNAQGKTNLLEALYLVSSTRLLRGQKDSEAIREGFDRAVVRAELEPGSTLLSVTLERGTRKRVALNGLNLPRASDALGRLPCICVSSADLPLISGEPSDRRLFLDLELSQLHAAYLRSLAVYKRALEQRNALLKTAQEELISGEQFEIWETDLAKQGAAIRESRSSFISKLEPFAQEAQATLGDGEVLRLDYVSRDSGFSEMELTRLLETGRRQEIARGTTLIGPHRDDFTVTIAGRDGRLYGSQGQQRTAMLSLKLGTMELERGERGAPPLLLLDDILSDLDEGRRARLLEWVVSHAGQTVLTCTEASAAGQAILSTARVLEIRAGAIVPS